MNVQNSYLHHWLVSVSYHTSTFVWTPHHVTNIFIACTSCTCIIYFEYFTILGSRLNVLNPYLHNLLVFTSHSNIFVLKIAYFEFIRPRVFVHHPGNSAQYVAVKWSPLQKHLCHHHQQNRHRHQHDEDISQGVKATKNNHFFSLSFSAKIAIVLRMGHYKKIAHFCVSVTIVWSITS